MCEILAVTWPEPRPFAAIAPWARALEFYGSGRFGWGVAWTVGGRVKVHKDTGQVADDPAVDGWLGAVESRHFLVHSRRPTLLSTIQLADTQPFLTEGGSLAFCHNGLFRERDACRPQYAARLRGGADSEIGFCMLTDLVDAGSPAVEALAVVAGKLGGNANLGTLAADGAISLFTRHETNRFWTFRLGDARIASTEMHSPDGSLFRLIFPDARDRTLIDGGVLL